MKGGVTSGIVYPPAVRVLADHFRFVNIGGTSAGAIAASLTAAAEYRRQTGGGNAGFDRIARVPADLAKGDALFGLFRPHRSTRALFDQAVLLSQSRSAADAPLKFAIKSFAGVAWPWAWAGAFLGLCAGGGLFWAAPSPAMAVGSLSILALGCVVGAGLALWRTIVVAQQLFIANGYGLSTGVAEDAPDDATVLGIWLGALLDEVAGLPAGEHLTFGHLWYGRRPLAQDDGHRPHEPLINPEVVSTCLSHGRPYTFPTGTDVFYFRPDALRR